MKIFIMMRFSVFSLLTLFILGCGGGGGDAVPLGSVSGIVTFDDKPLENAQVLFQPETGRASMGETDSNGKFNLAYTATKKGALIGSHVVIITSAVEAFSDESGEGKDRKGRAEILPKKYHSETTLKAKVESGSNTIDFELSSKE